MSGFSGGSASNNESLDAIEAAVTTLLATVATASALAAVATAIAASAAPVTSTETASTAAAGAATWYQLIAATANPVKFLALDGSLANTSGGTVDRIISLGTGPAGLEIVRGLSYHQILNATQSDFHIFVPIELPAGTRIAFQLNAASSNAGIGLTVGERA